jgi:hypothetical protein
MESHVYELERVNVKEWSPCVVIFGLKQESYNWAILFILAR